MSTTKTSANVPKLRFPGFEGAIPKYAVGELCDSIVPGRNKPEKFNGTIPWITTPDFEHHGRITNSKSGLAIDEKEARRVGSKIVPPSSVIMSCVGEIGLIALSANPVVLNQQLHAFLPSARIVPEFLLYALSVQKPQMEKLATTTAVPYPLHAPRSPSSKRSRRS
jgi:type I restriction enzyme S subunit